MKISIFFPFEDGPWGGANQFLKALRGELTRLSLYEEDLDKADAIIFNSHHDLKKVLKLRRKYPHKLFVHRVDGPIFFIRNKNLEIDKLIFKFSEQIADLTIFQSKWSFLKSKQLGLKENKYKIIYNAPDGKIFNSKNKKQLNGKKINLIAASWSSNWNKGFDIYQFLDQNLDFDKLSFTFVGNSPIEFKNANHIPPLSSNELAKKLKESDIYITASKNDPCSNALIEALSCGLPALALNDGGHPELIQNGGQTFNTANEVIPKLEKIVKNYSKFQEAIPDFSLEKIAGQYVDAIGTMIKTKKRKQLSFLSYFSFSSKIFITNLITRFGNLKR